ncbi:MAG: lytic transglycosylase domain-containing protein [Reyranella sp.]
MQRSITQAAALLFVQRRNPSSFPAKVRRAVAQAAVPIVVILLVLGVVGVAGRLHAEPAVDAQSQRKSAADPYVSFVHEAAQRFGVPASWISAVMAMESGGDVLALSPQGAMGLMQIMPDTWAGLRARHGLGADPYEPRDNILAGAAYLREMHDRYGSPGFLAAYNAGPARYDQYLATGRELPAETELYVAKLAPLIGAGQANDEVTVRRRVVPWLDSPLFAARDQSNPAATSSAFQTTLGRTSVSRSAAGVSPLAPPADGLFVRRGNANWLP